MKISEEYIWHLKARLRERPVFHIQQYNNQDTMLFQRNLMLIKCALVFFFSQVVKGNHLNDCQTHVALSFVGYAMFYMYCFVKGTNWILS